MLNNYYTQRELLHTVKMSKQWIKGHVDEKTLRLLNLGSEGLRPAAIRCPSNQEGEYRQGKAVPGTVMFIVNHTFENGNNLKRGNDFEQIKKLFSPYGYNFFCGYNINKDGILQKVAQYSRMENAGSLICFISSHGNQTSLACPDGNNVQIIDILKAAQTKELESCPKMFFFDACRSKTTSLDGKGLPEPPTSNYFVGFSCLDTKTSIEGKSDSCGVYFEEIINVFKDGFPRPYKEDGKVRDLNHFMNKVHFAVTKKYHQVPTVRTTLVGKIYFQKPECTENVPKNPPVFFSKENVTRPYKRRSIKRV